MSKKKYTKYLLSIHKKLSSVKDKEAKDVLELREVKLDAKEIHAKFLGNQNTLYTANQNFERVRCSFDEFDLWVKEEIDGIQHEDLEEKVH